MRHEDGASVTLGAAVRSKKAERDKLESSVEEFLRNGGEVEVLSVGASSMDQHKTAADQKAANVAKWRDGAM